MRPHDLWRAAGGTGRPVDYLRWLSRQWQEYMSQLDQGLEDEYRYWANASDVEVLRMHRADFGTWLTLRALRGPLPL
jgi:hypothetical protein